MKAKKILVFIIIILLLIGGALTFIYFKTDLFKSNSQKFWKYAVKNIEVVEMFNSSEMQSIKNRRSNTPYTIDSWLNIKNGENVYDLSINTNAENINNIATDVNLLYNNEKITSFTLVKRSNVIAFMLEELANGFIGIKNNDIKAIANEAGVEDTSDVPNSISWFSILDLLYVQESDEKYVVDTYSKFLSDYTSDEKYSTEESGIKVDGQFHQATGYKVTLTENEVKDIAKKVLAYLKDEDSRTVNIISSRLKLLNLSEKYTDYNVITAKIADLIEKIDSIETTDEVFMEMTVYVENGRTILTSIKIKDGSIIKIVFKKDESKLYITQDSPNKALATSENSIVRCIANIKEVTLSNELGDDNNSSTIKLYAELFNNYIVDYSSKIKIGSSGESMRNFDETPSIILNELEDKKLKETFININYGLRKIYENKKAIIGNQNTSNEQ